MSEQIKDLFGVLRALAAKDLREPNNFEAFMDVLLWIVFIILATVTSLSDSKVAVLTMFSLVFLATIASCGFCLHHSTMRRYKYRR